jgi:Txe/YoeB family toxin of Txe-Axe toxin-antitoxin module
MFKIIYFKSKALKKDQEKIIKNLEIAKKIKKSLEEMSFDPLVNSLSVKKLKPKEDERYRLRV